MSSVEVIGVVVVGVVMASILCVIAVGIAVGWVRRRGMKSGNGDGRRGV